MPTQSLARANRRMAVGKCSVTYPGFKFIDELPGTKAIARFEEIARTCYQSHAKMEDGSDEKLLNTIIRLGHGAMVEFITLCVMFLTNRGVTHELVRHRIPSYAQESTRYVKYDNVEFIIPGWCSAHAINNPAPRTQSFIKSCFRSTEDYAEHLKLSKAQEARGALNNNTATRIWAQTNLREWMHIFSLRADAPAHPDMRCLMAGLLSYLVENSYVFQFLYEIPKVKAVWEPNIEWFNYGWFLQKEGDMIYIIPLCDVDEGREEGEVWTDKC